MKVLAFDTSGPVLSVGLYIPGGTFALIRDAGLRHGELLAGQIEQLLSEANLQVKDLDLIVCSRGPGSFTGLRIGMAIAKGLSAGSGIPVVSIPTPDILVRPYAFSNSLVIPVLDAKKSRFYGACFLNGTRESEYFDLGAQEIIHRFMRPEGILICGPDAGSFKSQLSDTRNISFAPYTPASVFNMLSLGPVFLERHGPDPPGQGPLYVRKSEAELGREKKRGG